MKRFLFAEGVLLGDGCAHVQPLPTSSDEFNSSLVAPEHECMQTLLANALGYLKPENGLDVKQRYPLKGYDEDGTEIGDYFSDLLVQNCLIIKLKALKNIADKHRAQLIGYLRAYEIEPGLLINSGSCRFQIRKYALSSPSESVAGKLLSFLLSIFAFSAIFRG